MLYQARFALGCIEIKAMKIYIDGKYYDESSAKISVFDHGLLYGDGIFEGIRAYNGRVFKLKEHIDRLFCSAKAILLDDPDVARRPDGAPSSRPAAATSCATATSAWSSRAASARSGLNPNRCKNPSVIIIADKIQLYPPELYQQGHGDHHRARRCATCTAR